MPTDATPVTDDGTYEYVRYTPVRKDAMSETTQQQDRELADRILADLVFCAELNFHAKRNLASDDPELVYTGLNTVFSMEFKISRLGGWENFINDKRAKRADPADIDPLIKDTHLSGVSRPAHVPGYNEAQTAIAQAALAERKAELYAMDIEWPAKIMRGLRPSSKIREAEQAVAKAELFLAEHNMQQEELKLVAKTLETHPLAFMQLKAAKLVREIIKITLTTPMPDRAHLYQMCYEATKCWDEEGLLELWIMEADLLVHPHEEVSVLPPVKPAASTEFAHEFKPTDATSRTQGIDRTKEGGRKPKPTGKKGKGGRK